MRIWTIGWLCSLSLSVAAAQTELLPDTFYITSIAIDSTGAMYFGRSIPTADARTSAGVFQPRALSTDCGLSAQASQPCSHGYVVKVAPSGDRVLWATYFGGEGADAVERIAIAPDGNLFVAGSTTSKTLPLTGYSREPRGLFLAKLSAEGTAVLAGTYFGGPASWEHPRDRIGAMITDASGNVYLAGSAYSTPFPTTPGAFQRGHIPPAPFSVCGGIGDHFLAKFDAALGRLLFSTLAGTPGNDEVYDLAIGADGSLYVSGADGNNRICQHSMLTRVSADGSAVLYSLKSSRSGAAVAVAVDPAGNAYVATTPRGYVYPEGGEIWKLDPLGRILVSAAVPGNIQGMALARNGALLITGRASPLRLALTPGAPRACQDPATSIIGKEFLSRLSPETLVASYRGFLNSARSWLAGPDRLLVARPYTTAQNFAVLRPEPPPPGTVTCLANAASYDASYISPGEIVTVFGNRIGPIAAVGAQLDAAGNVTKTLDGVQVFVNRVAAPLLFASPEQINFVIPFSSAEAGTVTVEVRKNGQLVSSFEKLARFAHVGMFTRDSTGAGTLAALNQDLSVNSEANPASPGSVVAIFVTGTGAQAPQPVDGSRHPTTLSRPVTPIAAFVNGDEAQVEYAGNAPMLVAGALQINVRLPDPLRRPADIASPAFIQLVVGGERSGVFSAGPIHVR